MIVRMRLLFLFCFVFLSSSFEMFAARSSSAVQRILEHYTESLGGTSGVQALSSLSIKGSQLQGGKRYVF